MSNLIDRLRERARRANARKTRRDGVAPHEAPAAPATPSADPSLNLLADAFADFNLGLDAPSHDAPLITDDVDSLADAELERLTAPEPPPVEQVTMMDAPSGDETPSADAPPARRKRSRAAPEA